MRVVACGSRSWNDPATIRKRLASLPWNTILIHGGAFGADSLSGFYGSVFFRVPQLVFRPDWRLHGRRAGLLRNLRMLEQRPDLVLAFWDGKSKGTEHTIEQARKRGLVVEIVRQDERFARADSS